MENVILIVHLILALGLIAVVLLQRSEGGGLGIGGGGGGPMSGRAAATPLGKVTWMLAIAFIATSITLTILAATRTENASVVDRVRDVPAREEPAGDLPGGSDLLPPPVETDPNAPLVPPGSE